MKTGWESMRVGSIIYFIPFFFVMAPSLVLQGPDPWLEAFVLTVKAAIGTLLIRGGIQGYQAGIGNLRAAGWLEWPIRFLLIVGGHVLATPGGGILPIGRSELTLLALAMLVPTLALAWLLATRARAGAAGALVWPSR